jgi:hypothetical protein
MNRRVFLACSSLFFPRARLKCPPNFLDAPSPMFLQCGPWERWVWWPAPPSATRCSGSVLPQSLFRRLVRGQAWGTGRAYYTRWEALQDWYAAAVEDQGHEK